MFGVCEFLLRDMRDVVEIKQNLLFIGMFDERGALEILYGALIMAKEYKICGLYILYTSIFIGGATLFSQVFHDKAKLWHLILEYASERSLVELAKQCLLGIEKLNKLEFCDYCIL